MNRIKSSLLMFGLVVLLATPVGLAYAGEPTAEPATFGGCVLQVGEPPGMWSGIAISFQGVQYEVRDPIAGNLIDVVTVYHSIVQDKTDVGPFEPGLNPAIVFEGAGLLVNTIPFEDGALGSINAAFHSVVPDSSIDCDDSPDEGPPDDDSQVGGEFSSIVSSAKRFIVFCVSYEFFT